MAQQLRFSTVLILAGFSLFGCTKKESPKDQGPLTTAQLEARGQVVYQTACIACHHVDPHKDGSVGPAIAGSTLELVTNRVLHATYPVGYKPKRETAQMPALPHLEKEVSALHAFLNKL